jgi:peptidoglycan hydrolase CwlO-like protein
MKRVLSFSMLFCSLVASAQQPPPQPPTENELNGRMSALQNQRDEANNRIAYLAGQLAELQTRLAAMKKEADACAAANTEKK